MSKQRAQGTQAETSFVTILKNAGYADARRMPLAGSNDIGDIEVTIAGLPVTIESKATQVLNVQAELGKLRKKVQPAGRVPLLLWKRLVKVDGYRLRQPVAGERVVVTLALADLLALLAAASGPVAGVPGAPDGPGQTGAKGAAADQQGA